MSEFANLSFASKVGCFGNFLQNFLFKIGALICVLKKWPKNFNRIMVTPNIGRNNTELDRGYRSQGGPPPPPEGVLSAVISKKLKKNLEINYGIH